MYPILAPFEAIGALADGIDGPVNVLARPDNPRLEELEELGVARVTFGRRSPRLRSPSRRGSRRRRWRRAAADLGARSSRLV